MTPARGARKTTVCKTLARGARKTTVCKTLARKTTVCKMPVCKMPVCKTPARGVSTYRVRPSPGNVETPLAGVLCGRLVCGRLVCGRPAPAVVRITASIGLPNPTFPPGRITHNGNMGHPGLCCLIPVF